MITERAFSLVSILHETVLADSIVFFKKTLDCWEYVETAGDDDDLMAIVIVKHGIMAPTGFKVIAAKLDIDCAHSKQCRLVFTGAITDAFQNIKDAAAAYPLVRFKERTAQVDRVHIVPFKNLSHFSITRS